MKKFILNILFGGALLLSGCSKFLEKEPDSTRTELDTPEKVSQLLGTSYPQASYLTFAEAMSDNVVDKGNGFITVTNMDPFYYNDVKSNEQDSPEFYWASCYSAIAAANQALEACEKASNKAAYQSQKGEAMVARAYSHFMLVNFFSKFYDSTTASLDPGIPYVTEPETVVFKQYDRTSVKTVYDMIEKDLLEGIALIKDERYTVPKYHFTKAAAHAFATRFYLFKRNYQKVIEHASLVFPGNSIGESLRPWNTTYSTMTFEQLLDIYTSAEEPANLLLVETVSNYARNFPFYRYGLDISKTREIFTNTEGIMGSTAQWAYAILQFGEANIFIPKFNEYFAKTSVNANIGIPYTMIPLFTAEEVLFNRAEAYDWLGNTTAAISDLNLFASKRIRNYNTALHTISANSLMDFYGTNNLQVATIIAILEFRRTEFVQEGMRWFDILRYGASVMHTTSSGEVLEVLDSEDPRKLLQLPESVKTSGMPLNPR